MPEKTPRDPQPAPHDLILESRARLTVTGVQKVLHCNADSGCARGTETLIYANDSGSSPQLAACIQSQIVQSLDTVDRGLKERPNLIVLKDTTMPAVLVETAFIYNEDDAALLTNNADDFARAIARGITDFEGR